MILGFWFFSMLDFLAPCLKECVLFSFTALLNSTWWQSFQSFCHEGWEESSISSSISISSSSMISSISSSSISSSIHAPVKIQFKAAAFQGSAKECLDESVLGEHCWAGLRLLQSSFVCRRLQLCLSLLKVLVNESHCSCVLPLSLSLPLLLL